MDGPRSTSPATAAAASATIVNAPTAAISALSATAATNAPSPIVAQTQQKKPAQQSSHRSKPRFAQAAPTFKLPSIGARSLGPAGIEGPAASSDEPDLHDTLAKGSVLAKPGKGKSLAAAAGPFGAGNTSGQTNVAQMGSSLGATTSTLGRRHQMFTLGNGPEAHDAANAAVAASAGASNSASSLAAGAGGHLSTSIGSRAAKALKDRDSLRSALVNIIMQPGAMAANQLPPLPGHVTDMSAEQLADISKQLGGAAPAAMGGEMSLVDGGEAPATHVDGSEEEEQDAGPVGTEADKDLLRYYYYINHGIDTEQVTAMDRSWLDHILALLDSRLKARGPQLIDSLSQDIREDYLLSVKKSIVDFVLKDPQTENTGDGADWPAYKRYPELSTVPKAWTPGYAAARAALDRNLYLCHPAVAAMLTLWYAHFADVRMIKPSEFRRKRAALDISVFTKMVSMQIDEARHALQRQWVAQAAEIVHSHLYAQAAGNSSTTNASNSHHPQPSVPPARRAAFLELCAAVMSAQLRELVLASVREFVDMLCPHDKDEQSGAASGPAQTPASKTLSKAQRSASAAIQAPNSAFKGFVLRLSLVEDKLTCSPDIPSLETAVMRLVQRMVSSVEELARLEYSFPDADKPAGRQRFLQPAVAEELLEPHVQRLHRMFASQAGRPDEYVATFVAYQGLVSRTAEEDLSRFLDGKRAFVEQTREVGRYRRLASEVQYDLAKVATIGIFEIHNESATAELAVRANGLADRILARIAHEVQVR